MKKDIGRIDWRFKLLYAVAIIMVCCGHTNGGGLNLFADWFPYVGMHLALFVFSAGYFYKDSDEEKMGEWLLKKLKKLIIPLYLYNVAYAVIVVLLKKIGFDIGGDFTLYNLLIAPITDGHQFIYNLGGWFIIPFFLVETVNILFRKLLGRLGRVPEPVYFALSVAVGLLGNQLACMGYREGLWLILVRTLYFLPFYGLGIFYRRGLEKWERKIPNFWCFAILFSVKLLLTYGYGKVLGYTPSWCNDFTEGPLMPIVVGYLGIAM